MEKTLKLFVSSNVYKNKGMSWTDLLMLVTSIYKHETQQKKVISIIPLVNKEPKIVGTYFEF